MLNLEQLKDNLESGIISYDNFVKIANEHKLSFDDIFELISDEIAENMDINDFPIIESFVSLIRKNIELEFNCNSMVDYEYQPNEDGGIYTLSLVLNGCDLGFLGNLLNITTVFNIRIDFRPAQYLYGELHIINVSNERENLLGECNYIHFEFDNYSGKILDYYMESM